MNKILIAVMALVLAVPLCYAAEDAKPMATEPVGAVVETGGVIVGTIMSGRTLAGWWICASTLLRKGYSLQR